MTSDDQQTAIGEELDMVPAPELGEHRMRQKPLDSRKRSSGDIRRPSVYLAAVHGHEPGCGLVGGVEKVEPGVGQFRVMPRDSTDGVIICGDPYDIEITEVPEPLLYDLVDLGRGSCPPSSSPECDRRRM